MNQRLKHSTNGPNRFTNLKTPVQRTTEDQQGDSNVTAEIQEIAAAKWNEFLTSARESIRSQPVLAIGVAAAIGFVLGLASRE